MNRDVIRDPKIIREYISWLFDKYPSIPGMKIYDVLDNDEKRELENNCEWVSNLFFEWLELEFPHIRKISVKQKNMLLTKYCSEVGESEHDSRYKQSNFDLWLSHRYDKKTIKINGKSTRWYYINKTPFELENMPHGKDSEFWSNEIENMDGVTY